MSDTNLKIKQLEEKLIEAEKLASLGALVAGITHEVNTPLGVSYTGLSTLQDLICQLKKHLANDTLSIEEFTVFLEQTDEIIPLIINNMQRATQLIQSFKQIAVTQTSNAHYKFSLKKLVDDCVLSLKNQLKQKSINVLVNIDNDLELDTEPGVFAQVVSNFIQNSIIHGFEDSTTGEIELQASMNSHQLEITYYDNGKGMDATQLTRLYEPFYTTKMGEGGSGLGMHIVHNLITQKLGGTLTCKSEPEQGVCYHITIPKANLLPKQQRP